MSDYVAIRKQKDCAEASQQDDRFLVDIFSGAHGHDGSFKQLYVYIRKAVIDPVCRPVSLELQEEQCRLGLCRVLSMHFCWKGEKTKKLITKIDMGDFSASKEVKRRKIEEMSFPEKIVFTLPTCNATQMEIIASLLNEKQEQLLTTGPKVIDLSKLRVPTEETGDPVEHNSVQDHTT